MIVDLKISISSETAEKEWAYKRVYPLARDEIEKIANLNEMFDKWDDFDYVKFARAIEEAHGIK